MQSIHANQHHGGPALETAGLTKRFGERVAVGLRDRVQAVILACEAGLVTLGGA